MTIFLWRPSGASQWTATEINDSQIPPGQSPCKLCLNENSTGGAPKKFSNLKEKMDHAVYHTTQIPYLEAIARLCFANDCSKCSNNPPLLSEIKTESFGEERKSSKNIPAVEESEFNGLEIHELEQQKGHQNLAPITNHSQRGVTGEGGSPIEANSTPNEVSGHGETELNETESLIPNNIFLRQTHLSHPETHLSHPGTHLTYPETFNKTAAEIWINGIANLQFGTGHESCAIQSQSTSMSNPITSEPVWRPVFPLKRTTNPPSRYINSDTPSKKMCKLALGSEKPTKTPEKLRSLNVSGSKNNWNKKNQEGLPEKLSHKDLALLNVPHIFHRIDRPFLKVHWTV
jgi:hypothetical protein